mmetsp:Transcript_19232/g.44986  ORF Transcript_19232/g.44986 Transcript_19232/m.44986 type:complete len:99 (+) Transcript_19232:1-297(+)
MTFPQGDIAPGPWRCRKCYATRFETMCFGMNDDGATHCRHCDCARAECGWSIWLNYDQLPRSWQRSVTAQHAPKVLSLLGTKWPGCSVTYDARGPPSV